MSLTDLSQPRSSSQRVAPPRLRGGATDEDESAENPGYLSVETLRKKRNDYLTNKTAEIEEQREGRHYYHGAQHTAGEAEILRKRKQPIITYNLVGPKINGICGLIERQRQDPKASPRTPQDEEGADIATAAVRYVVDANEWRSKRFDCMLRAAYEGIAGVELNLVKGDHDDPDISISVVDGENFFYDARSVRPDFSDDRSHGVAKWMDIDEAVDLLPDKEEELNGLIENGSDLSSNAMADRENRFAWINGKRLLLVEHWYKYKGRWCWAFYVGTTLLDEGESPFFDERKNSMSRFVMWSAAVDHDGDRYGYPRNLKGPQDEVNQRRSKALWTSVSRQALVPKGSVDDVEVMRRELMRPDGIVEYNPGPGKPEKIDQTSDMAAQLQFMQDAITYIQNFASTDAAAMAGVSKNLSGRAVNLLQQPGIAQIGPFINVYRAWQLKVYRAIWCMAQRHWTAERWIRITDDEQIAKFLQINGMELDQYGLPVLVNSLGNLDVDIVMDEGPDVQTMEGDAFDQLSTRADVPLPMLIELMPIKGSVKQKFRDMLKPQGPPPPDPKVMQIQMQAQLDEKSDQRKAQIEEVQAQADIATQHEKIKAEMGQDEREFQLKKELAFMEASLEQEAFRREEARKDREHQQKMALAREQKRPDAQPRAAPASKPHGGARRAPDGKYYVSDPQRPGKYLMVA